jgi:hypothetical protein
MRRHAIVLSLIGALALLAGCGDADTTGKQTSETSTEAAPGPGSDGHDGY